MNRATTSIKTVMPTVTPTADVPLASQIRRGGQKLIEIGITANYSAPTGTRCKGGL